MNKIEILAPAGGFDSAVAAVRSGADAIYIGARSFSARASAHNFDYDEMLECTRYCHQRGVRVYLALNTIVFDDELTSALEVAKQAARADIDAFIIQDMGLVSLIRQAIPQMKLHASTQMTVHTPYGARALYDLGFERVVLSRELSLDEIREIHEFCPQVELEVFVHGALCMCLSGQCYFSAMLGGRSANRGMCAQPCRLPMSFNGSDHALSLKDNGSLDHIKELEEIGVISAKIEGRMKRPEYVAAATAAAKEARDLGRVSRESEDRLRAVFSRTGFTDGYLRGDIGPDMFGYRTRDDVVSADAALLKEIRSGCKDELQTVPLRMSLWARVGERPRLTASDGEHTVEVTGDAPAQQAISLPLSAERAAQSLGKTGGTQYYLDSFSADTGEDVSLPAAALNALRREAIKALDNARARWHEYEIKDFDIDNDEPGCVNAPPENRVCVNAPDYPRELESLGRVYTALDAIADPSAFKGGGVEAPRACFGNEKTVYEKLRALRGHGCSHLIAHNIGTLYIGRELGYTVHAGFGLNLANSRALQWARDYGVADAELSPEIDLKRIEKLNKAIPVGVIRYGYLPLMLTRSAPAGAPTDSAETCKSIGFLQDRKDERFPVILRDGYCEILNCVPIILPQKDYNAGKGVFNVFHFTVENSVEKMKKSYEKIRENRTFNRMTHGLYIRGVKNFTI